jgi:nucleoside triphosphate diphosphatase
MLLAIFLLPDRPCQEHADVTGSAMGREARKTLSDLLAVMAALRTPGSGCPWDLEQTFASIAPYTIEEAYEVAEAIANGDRSAMLEELGDLLLQVVYHARMAEEEGAFAFADVVDRITRKMLRRHPHVFGTAAERAAGAAPGFWERIKDAEKRERGGHGPTARSEEDTPHAVQRRRQRASILDGIGKALPSLTRAIKLQNKAAQVGFDWPELAQVLGKLNEELGELRRAIAAARSRHPRADAAIAEEFGDVLFVMANLARHLRIDPEASLRAANAKFVRRFRRIEERLAEQGRSPEQATLAEMDRMWDEAKAEERALPALAVGRDGGAKPAQHHARPPSPPLSGGRKPRSSPQAASEGVAAPRRQRGKSGPGNEKGKGRERGRTRAGE